MDSPKKRKSIATERLTERYPQADNDSQKNSQIQQYNYDENTSNSQFGNNQLSSFHARY